MVQWRETLWDMNWCIFIFLCFIPLRILEGCVDGIRHGTSGSKVRLKRVRLFSGDIKIYIHCCCHYSVTQSCPTFCNFMDCSTPDFPVYHQLLELAQTHVQQVNDAILLSYPLSSPSPPALNLSQHQSTFQWVTPGDWSIGTSASASVFPINIQDWFPLGWTGLILQSKELSRVFSNTTVQKHQFFSAQISLWSHPYIHTWLLEKP